jgi:hypothetical protein
MWREIEIGLKGRKLSGVILSPPGLIAHFTACLATGFATVARILITGSHRECAKGQEDQLRGWRENGRDERFY